MMTSTSMPGRNVVEDSASASTIMPSPGLTSQAQPVGSSGAGSGLDVGTTSRPSQDGAGQVTGPFSRNLIPDESAGQVIAPQPQSSLVQPQEQTQEQATLNSQTTQQARPASSFPAQGSMEYLSPGWLDGDDNERDILSGAIRSGSREGELLGDLKRVEQGVTGRQGGRVLGRVSRMSVLDRKSFVEN